MKLQPLSQRKTLSIIVMLCTIALFYALYAEYYLNIEPCPLCIVERVDIVAIALLGFLFALHNPKQLWLTRIYGLILAIVALCGIKIAAHHVWLMNLPADKQPLSCGMPLAVLYKSLPLHSFLAKILMGDAECSKITWQIFGITPPFAVIILCVIVTILAGLLVFRNNAAKNTK